MYALGVCIYAIFTGCFTPVAMKMHSAQEKFKHNGNIEMYKGQVAGSIDMSKNPLLTAFKRFPISMPTFQRLFYNLIAYDPYQRYSCEEYLHFVESNRQGLMEDYINIKALI